MAQHESKRVLRPAEYGRRGSRYVASLDGLRTFAVLAVIFYHMKMTWAPGGLMGVTVFFVISGYLICGLLVAEYDSTGTISLGQFWLRRVRRIIPAVLLAIAGTLVLCALFNPALFAKARADLVPSLLFYNNWWQVFREVSYFEAAGAPSPLTHFWSLAIEEQFYIVWPVFLLFLFRRRLPKGVIAIIIGILAVLSGTELALLYDPTADPSRIYYGTDTRAVSLLIGALLSFVWPSTIFGHRRRPAKSAAGRLAFNIMGVAALVGLITIIGLTNSYMAFPYQGGIVIVSVLTALLIAALVVPNTWVARLLQTEPLVWIGKRSYGMYLWHYPIILTTASITSTVEIPWWVRLAQIILVIALADVSYRFVENPIRMGAIRRWWKRVRSVGFRTAWSALSTRGMATAIACALLACGAAATLVIMPVNASDETPATNAASQQLLDSQASSNASSSGSSAGNSDSTASSSAASKDTSSASASKTAKSSSASASSKSSSSSTAASKSSSKAQAKSSKAASSKSAAKTNAGTSAKDKTTLAAIIMDSFYKKTEELPDDERAQAELQMRGLVGRLADTVAESIDESIAEMARQEREAAYDDLFLTEHYNKAGGVVYDPVLIGDSVAAGCENEFYKAFPNGHSDALVNRSIWESPYGYYCDNGQAGTYVIFCLGTNNAVIDEQMDELFASVPKDKKVVLVNIRCPRDWEAQTNEAIANAAKRYDNVIALVDWYGESAGHDEYFYEDGIHLNSEGAKAYIGLIREAIENSL